MRSNTLKHDKDKTGYQKLSRLVSKRIVPSLPLYALMLPAIVYLILLNYMPLYGIQIAFRNYTPKGGITGSTWVGMYHFIRFFRSSSFWQLMRNTLTLNLLSLMTFPLPIILALLLNWSISRRFSKIVQLVTYAPHFISVVVLVSMISIFFSPSMGVFSKLLEVLTGQKNNVLIQPEIFKYLYIGSDIWQGTGWASIIYIGALTSINPELHEAAIMDGATKLKRIRHIELPGIAPTVTVMFILRMGSIMSLGFQKVFLMQNSAILSTSETIQTYVYKVGLQQSNFSYSTAIGLFNTIINITMLIIANTLSRRFSESSLY